MKKQHKILYIGNDIPNRNASAIRVFSNALALSQFGYSVEILSFDHMLTSENTENINGIKVYHDVYPSSNKEYFNYIFSIKKYTELGKQYDYLIAYELPSIATYRLIQWCHKNDKKFICDCAEWHSVNHLSGIPKIIKALDIWLCMNFCYKQSDGIIVISSYLEKHFKKNKTVLVPPLQYEKMDYSNQVSDKQITRLIYAGNPDADKDNLGLIISTLTSVEEPYQFDIFGVSGEKFNINDKRIHFWGTVPHETVLKNLILSNFQIIIRDPSRRNNAGFPTKFAESIMCGVPVIANNFSDVWDYIDRYGVGLKCEQKELKKTISYAITMSTEKKKYMKECCLNCHEFNYEYQQEKIGKFLADL